MVEDDVGVFVARPAVSPGLRPYGLLVARVGEPVLGPFSWGRDHRRDQDQRVDRTTIGDQRRRVAAEGLTDHDQVTSVTDGVDHGIGVVAESRGVIVAGQVGRERLVASSA